MAKQFRTTVVGLGAAGRYQMWYPEATPVPTVVNVTLVPTEAMTVGPMETWKTEKVSIWHPGYHDNPFGIRLSTLMISKRIPDSPVPMSLLADHPSVQFNYLRSGIESVTVEMH